MGRLVPAACAAALLAGSASAVPTDELQALTWILDSLEGSVNAPNVPIAGGIRDILEELTEGVVGQDLSLATEFAEYQEAFLQYRMAFGSALNGNEWQDGVNDYLGRIDPSIALIRDDIDIIRFEVAAHLENIATSASATASRLNTTNALLTGMSVLQQQGNQQISKLATTAAAIDAQTDMLSLQLDTVNNRLQTLIDQGGGEFPPVPEPAFPDVAGPEGLPWDIEGDSPGDSVGDLAQSVDRFNWDPIQLAPDSVAPVWTLNVPLSELEFAGITDLAYTIDWSFWAPFRVFSHPIILAMVGVWAAARVWEELRRYG